MALTLVEMAKIEENPLRKGVISTLLFESNVMQMIPWEDIGALSTTVIRFKNLPSVGFRYVNESYSESTGTFDQIQESVYPLGGDIDVDIMFIQNKAAVASPRATQTEMKLKAVAYQFNQSFLNGDQAIDPRSFDGVKKRVANMPAGGTGGQTLTAGGTLGTNGLDVIASTANQHAFIDSLDALAYACDGHMADAFLMNRQTLLRTRSVLRRLALLNVNEDQFGRFIDHYGSIPLYDIGVQADQTTQIIGNAETQGSAVDATSIYALKYGSEAFLGGLQEYALRVTDFGELETKPVYRTRVDWPIGLATWHPRCIARMVGLRMIT
jgi:hypothetical protein